MNKILLTVSLLAPLCSVACGGAIRVGDAYRDDTAKLITAQANPRIHDCFDGMVKSGPREAAKNLAGTTTVHFTVSKETGLITNPTVVPEQTTAQPPVAQCVVASLAGLKLDPPDNVDGEATFTWEFVVQ
jgi:hypothetical protein